MIRFIRFNVVGAIGIGVQLSVVGALVHGFGVDPVLATAAGVSAAVLHNFGWHARWTWRDRMRPGVSHLAAFIRFAGANGVISLVGSILMMPLLTGAGLPAIPANLVTIALCGLLNYWAAGRVSFRALKPSNTHVPAVPANAASGTRRRTAKAIKTMTRPMIARWRSSPASALAVSSVRPGNRNAR